jgi:hypothetical protein
MGNHNVGRAMAAAAKGFWAGNGDAPVSKEKALAVLDATAEEFRGADAEFDDHCWPDEPLGRLLAVAFGPWTEDDDKKNNADPNNVGMHWYEKIETPFSERYGFC